MVSSSSNEVVLLVNDNQIESMSPGTVTVPLYNADAALLIPKNVADGYLILLSGGLKSAKAVANQRNKNDASDPSSGGESTAQSYDSRRLSADERSAISLAFAALTDGNVIEAMFGVESNGGIRGKNTSQVAFNAVRDAKQALIDASSASESIKQLSVETYCKCFEVILKYHLGLESVGFIMYCIKQHKIRETAVEELAKAFQQLNEAVAASI
jgi:hypothetical protein